MRRYAYICVDLRKGTRASLTTGILVHKYVNIALAPISDLYRKLHVRGAVLIRFPIDLSAYALSSGVIRARTFSCVGKKTYVS